MTGTSIGGFTYSIPTMNPTTANTPAAANRPAAGTPHGLRLGRTLRQQAHRHVPRITIRPPTDQPPPTSPPSTRPTALLRPRYWTFEGYLAQRYLDQEEFLHDLWLLANCRGRTRPAMLIKMYCRRLAHYYGSEEGLGLLGALMVARIEAIQHQSATLHLVDVGLTAQQQQQQQQTSSSPAIATVARIYTLSASHQGDSQREHSPWTTENKLSWSTNFVYLKSRNGAYSSTADFSSGTVEIAKQSPSACA
ncbi:hypothetical protein B0O80DRAFT_504230 [Mortierella sp. GBAus27b]|nr:hypothetical protein B0O80DRAFT_504230 [Mortierella sp. GBAus27b]